jgi:hypothetical protein
MGVCPPGFHFVDDPHADRDPAARLVRVPKGVRRKRQLLRLYAEQLELPGYFGWNWDALEECMRDLAWIPQPKRIMLIHSSLPFRKGDRDRRTYVQILENASRFWIAGKLHELVAVFPSASEQEVGALLAGEAK